jgi:chloramphenicol 3-O-phosphotransferase
MGDVVLLTGPSGSGKTTVARLVASDAGRPTVLVTTDEFFGAIRTGFVPPYLPESQTQNVVVVDAIVAAVAVYADGGYDVVVDGVIGPWFLPPYRRAAREGNWRMSYVVLRPDLATTLARGRNRGATELTDTEALTGLHGAFTDLGELDKHAIDTGGLSPEETAAEVRKAVASGDYLLV